MRLADEKFAVNGGGTESSAAARNSSGPDSGSAPEIRVLVVDPDASFRDNVQALVRSQGHEGKAEEDLDRAARLVAGQGSGRGFDLILLDEALADGDLGPWIHGVRENTPSSFVAVTTSSPSANRGVEVLQLGASDYVAKPLSAGQLEALLGHAAHIRSRSSVSPDGADVEHLTLENGGHLLGVSASHRAAVKRALRSAPSDASILLIGESGTGKELFARLIHQRSRRADREFLPLNCAALPEELLESEMFGHRRGAFTGAVRDKPGLLETAHRGTAFLDEITEMPLSLQAKLLRVVQDGVVRRVGSEHIDGTVDVRFVSATNRDPVEAVEDGHLRRDLYFRLGVVPIRLPSLRERVEDIPVLARFFLSRWWGRHRSDGPPPELSPAALEWMIAYSWPGNVRELENVMEQAVIFVEPGAKITPDDLPLGELLGIDVSNGNGSVAASNGTGRAVGHGGDWRDLVDAGTAYHEAKDGLVERFEREYLARVVNRAQGNISEAARMAGVDRTTLYRMMERHGLSKEMLTG